jgi:hypothetical protein
MLMFTPDDDWIEVVGGAAGVAVALAIRPLLARLSRGHSRSQRHFRYLAWLSVAGLACAGVALAVGLNGFLDTSPTTRRLGSVTSASHYEDDGDRRTKAVLKWDDGEVEERGFDDSPWGIAEGDRVFRDTRRGRFDARWVVKGVTVRSGGDGKLPD